MIEVLKEEKEDESKFVALIDKDGRVSVNISGKHVNKRTFNRMVLAFRKIYRSHIKEYRKHIRRDMTNAEIEEIVAEPADLEVEANGRVLENLSVTDPGEFNKDTVKEVKKLSLTEVIEAKRSKQLAETK